MTVSIPDHIRSAPLAIAVTGALLYVMAALLQQRLPTPSIGCADPAFCRPIKIIKISPDREPPADPTIERIVMDEIPEPPIGVAEHSQDPVVTRVNPPVAGEFGFMLGKAAPPTQGPLVPPEPLDNAPALLVRRPQPQFPPIAIRQALSGYVDVRFDVLESGATSNVVVVFASDAVFTNAALRAARKLKFRARHVDGEAVISRDHEMRFRFDFAAH
ncbi:MAG: TonB family protein [Pseudomonadota bacterium]